MVSDAYVASSAYRRYARETWIYRRSVVSVTGVPDSKSCAQPHTVAFNPSDAAWSIPTTAAAREPRFRLGA